MSLRQIRAIPHNAILQQIGYPVNVIAGAGTAAGDEMEAIAELLGQSDRGQPARAAAARGQWPCLDQDRGRPWRTVQFGLLGQPPLSRHRKPSSNRRAWRLPNI
jgi:hypothetical protein